MKLLWIRLSSHHQHQQAAAAATGRSLFCFSSHVARFNGKPQATQTCHDNRSTVKEKIHVDYPHSRFRFRVKIHTESVCFCIHVLRYNAPLFHSFFFTFLWIVIYLFFISLRARHTSLPRLSTSHGRYFKKEKQSTRGKLLKKKPMKKRADF
jgi:hypothetical protein